MSIFQDSLWNVKKADSAADAYNQQLAAAAYGQQQQQHYDQYYPTTTTAAAHPAVVADAIASGAVSASGGDYTHYPYPDEYLNDRNRQYLAASSADAYAHLNQQQHPRNHRLDSDCKLHIGAT